MSGTAWHLRLMLRQYELQFLVGLRLARLRHIKRLAEGNTELQSPEERAARRKTMVERVAQELYESILFHGKDIPIVDKIRERMTPIMGAKLRFTYPAGKEKLTLIREDAEGMRQLTVEEEERALNALWYLTVRAVDESML